MKTVYVGSLWHQDCDPFASVVALDAKTAQKALDKTAEEEFEACSDQDTGCDDYQYEDDIMTGGIFPESLHEVLKGVIPASEVKTIVQDLRDQGYAWLPTF